jgi:hypothetical protein
MHASYTFRFAFISNLVAANVQDLSTGFTTHVPQHCTSETMGGTSKRLLNACQHSPCRLLPTKRVEQRTGQMLGEDPTAMKEAPL